MFKKSYIENYDILMALITHLSLTAHKSRTPTNIAHSLGIEDEKEKVFNVLNEFNEFFRRSNKKGENNEHFYTVHVRYALRRTKEGGVISDPLDSNAVFSMIQQVAEMVRLEQEKNLTKEELKNEYNNLLLSIKSQNEKAEQEFKIRTLELENSNKSVQRSTTLTLIAAIVAAIATILVPLLEKAS